MAHFKKLLDKYADEIASPSDEDRKGLFANLETRLKRALARMEELKPSTKHLPDGSSVAPQRTAAPVLPAVGGPGSVKAMAKLHDQRIASVGAVDKQGELIVRLRQWLFRQGAKLTPNGTIVWNKSTAVLKYDTELAQQAMTRIALRGGLLYGADGALLDTSRMVTAASGPGWCIYVMSGENNIHVSSHSVGGRHHSSLLAGENVACAGEMEVRRGKLVTLSNKSGHYQPEPVYLTQVIRVLSDAGVDEISYGIKEYSLGPIVHHKTAKDFLDLQRVPVWPSDDINSDDLVENPNYPVGLAGELYSLSYGGSDSSSYPASGPNYVM